MFDFTETGAGIRCELVMLIIRRGLNTQSSRKL